MFGALYSTSNEPRSTTDTPEVALPEDEIPDLRSHTGPDRLAVDASGPPRRDRASLSVEVRGGATPLHVLAFDGRTGSLLAQQPAKPPFPVTVRFELPQGDVRLHATRFPQRGKTHYVARAVARLRTGTTLALDARERTITVRLEATDASNVGNLPVLLRRKGEPDWRPLRDAVGAVDRPFTTSAKGEVVFTVGPGNYTLSIPGFTVDAADRDRLAFSIDAFDSSRPIRGRAR